MKRFLVVLFVIILTASMLLAGEGCKKNGETAATEATLAETTTAEMTAETTTAETTASVSEKLNLGVATVKDPDPEMIVESEVLGSVPANQVGIILAEGLIHTDAQKIADELDASIIGEIEFINFYQLETQDSTEEEIIATLDKAAKIDGVDLAFPNGAVLPQVQLKAAAALP